MLAVEGGATQVQRQLYANWQIARVQAVSSAWPPLQQRDVAVLAMQDGHSVRKQRCRSSKHKLVASIAVRLVLK